MKNIIFLFIGCAMYGAFFDVSAQQVPLRGTDGNMAIVAAEKIKMKKVDDPQGVSHEYPEECEMAMNSPHVKISARGRCIFKSVNLFKESYLCAIVDIMYDGTKVVQFPQASPVKTIVRWKKNKISALFIIVLMLINNLLLLVLKKKRIIIISSIYVTGFVAFGLGIKVLLSSLATILLVAIAAVVLVIIAEDSLIRRVLRGGAPQNFWRYIISGSIVFYLSTIYYIFI